MSEMIRSRVERLAPLFAGPPKSHRRLSPGQLAELRRLEPDALTAPAFWTVLAAELDDDLPADGDPRRADAEGRWAVALRAMATLADLYRKGHRLGWALAASGFSEMRLQRLLDCPAERLAVEIQTAARFLAAKGEAVDYADLVRLALEAEPSRAESVRRDVARDYFRAVHRKDRADDTDDTQGASRADERS